MHSQTESLMMSFLFVLQCLNVDSNSCFQELPHSIPPPPPSPVSDITQPFAYLATNMPNPSDFFPLSPRPEGDEISNNIYQHGGGDVCYSSSPTPLALPGCSVPRLTPIPECEEVNSPSPLFSQTEIIPSPQVETSLSSPKVLMASESEPFHPTSPKLVGTLNSRLNTSPKPVQTSTVEVAACPSSPTFPVFYTASCTVSEHTDIKANSEKATFMSHTEVKDPSHFSETCLGPTNLSQSPVMICGKKSSSDLTNPLQIKQPPKIPSKPSSVSQNYDMISTRQVSQDTSSSDNMTSDKTSLSNHQLTAQVSQSTDSVVTSQKSFSEVSVSDPKSRSGVPTLNPQIDAEVSTSAHHSNVLVSQMEAPSFVSTRNYLSAGQVPMQSPVSFDKAVPSTISPVIAVTSDTSIESPTLTSNSPLNLRNDFSSESSGKDSFNKHISSSFNVLDNTGTNAKVLLKKPKCNGNNLEHIRPKQVTNINQNSVKKSNLEKTVRFKIDETHNVSEFIPELSDSNAGMMNPQNVCKLEESAYNHNLHSSHSCITSSVFPSQAKNLQTSSELDTEPEVAMLVPVTSTNIPESSHSVPKTTEPEHIHMGYDAVDSSCSVLISTNNIEKRQAEIFENHAVVAQTISEVPSHLLQRTETQTSVETECQLPSESREQYPDHLVTHRGTLDYISDSVASSSSQPEEYKVK